MTTIQRIRQQLTANQVVALDMLLEIDPKGLYKAIQELVLVQKEKDYWSNGVTITTVKVTPAFKAYLRERF